jgi:tRNA threonylcarbamoyl adenosine modification protein (Sua5/YciO/YrdC/YwlC family)
MRTEYLTLDGSAADADKIAHAAKLLQAGSLVAFPTETVYGLGADARNPEALARLTKVKGRRDGKPYSLLIPSLRHAEEASGGLSRIAQKLARVYWPGPLTMVVPRKEGGSVGLRLPEHPVTRSLLRLCGIPLATPSANRSGSAEPVSARQVRESLDGEIALILDGGPAWQGKPSTVVKVGADNVAIQREGTVSADEIIELARPTLLFVCAGNTCRSPMAEGFFQMILSSGLEGAAKQQHDKDALPFRVLSAGIHADNGERADAMAVAAMRELSIDISRHRTSSLDMAMIDSADWIFTMTHSQKEFVLALMPSCENRVQTLCMRGDDIPDPVAKSLDCYRQVRDKIAICLRDVVRLVNGSAE